MCTPWQRQRDYWLYQVVTDEQLLLVICRYSCSYPDDSTTVLWLSSRGTKGEDTGESRTEEIARICGGFRHRISEVENDGYYDGSRN